MSLLSSLPELDALRANSSSNGRTSRSGTIDVVGDIQNEADVPICHMIYFMPFSTLDSNGNRAVYNEITTLESGAAVMLAAQHLNAGNGSLVPDLGGLSDQCPIRFTVEWVDTEFVESSAVNSAIELTDRKLPEREPCAIIGAVRSAVSIPTSLITGLRGYPQVSGMSTSATLDDKTLYPLFGRTVPSDVGTATAAVLYIRYVLGIRFIAMVHTSDAYGTAYARGMRDVIPEHAPDLAIVTFILRFGASKEEARNVVKLLKDTQSMYFFGVLFNDDADAVLTEAIEQGIAGTGRHNWLFSDAIGSVEARAIRRNSVLRKAYQGTSVTKATASSDVLAAAMRELGSSKEDIDHLKSILPRYQDGPDSEPKLIHTDIVDGESFLSSPGLWAGFLFDATIAVGLSACAAARNDGAEGGIYLDGAEHYNSMMNLTFNGATGKLVFDPMTGSRKATSATFEVVNFFEDTTFDDGSGAVKFKAVQTDVFQGGEWTNIQPYIFNDGTSNAPPYLPDITVDSNYFTTALRAAALALCAVILLLSLGFSAWTHVHRKVKVCRSSQPLFLHIICAGVFILGLSVIPLSIDRGIASERGSDMACMAFPWLICIGVSATFSALYSKTHRINLVFNARQFRRIAVKPKDVVVPMFVLLSANIIVLAVWTVLAPLRVDTEILATDPFDRAIETYDYCVSDDMLPYVICLGVINFAALFLATFEAYRAKDIPLEYAESEYIFRAMACIVLVCFIGIPIMVIAYDNPSACEQSI